MDIEDAFRQVGEYGALQRQVFWTMAIPQVFVAWHHVHNVFVGAQPRFFCIRGTERTEGCPKADQLPCEKYDFVGTDFSSVASEVNIICC